MTQLKDSKGRDETQSLLFAATGFFGSTSKGEAVSLHTLSNGWMTLRLLDFGGAVHSIDVPDRQGQRENILLGYDTLSEYEQDNCWCGMLCGPVAGRIAGASYELDGVKTVLQANDGSSCLHSGPVGFSKSLWRGEAFCDGRFAGVRFTLTTLPGQWGFPGVLLVTATYSLDREGLFSLEWEGRSSAPVLFAPTFHGYFNLGGPSSLSAAECTLSLDAGHFMPLDEKNLPCLPEGVEGRAFDFRVPRSPEAPLRTPELQILRGKGYDHPFVLSEGRDAAVPCAVLYHRKSGRRMELFTDQPVVILYTGGNLSSSQKFSEGRRGSPHLALALEPQGYPNASAHPSLPLPVLRPGEVWRSRSAWRFSVPREE